VILYELMVKEGIIILLNFYICGTIRLYSKNRKLHVYKNNKGMFHEVI
jgi:hypothetical protein